MEVTDIVGTKYELKSVSELIESLNNVKNKDNKYVCPACKSILKIDEIHGILFYICSNAACSNVHRYKIPESIVKEIVGLKGKMVHIGDLDLDVSIDVSEYKKQFERD